MHVAERKWDARHGRPGCGETFYDLRRAVPACPGCDAVVEIQTGRRKRRGPPPQARCSAEGASDRDDGGRSGGVMDRMETAAS